MSAHPYVLCVDDEPLVLEGLERTLRDNFEIVTETKPLAALALLERRTHDFAAIVSDMRMPLMDGAKFLACAAEIAPHATRLLLTGHAEINAAIAAVNTGRIFRFLCKPCPPNELLAALEAAVEQHRLQTLERHLLEETLAGSVRLLAEVLALAAPQVFAQSQRVQAYVLYMVRRLGREDSWRFELAACLHLIGCVGLPEQALERLLSGQTHDSQEAQAMAEHVLTAHALLRRIPRFEDVAEMIRLEGTEAAPVAPAAGTQSAAPDVELGARLLRVARQIARRVQAGASEHDAALELMPGSSPAEAELLGLMTDYRSVSLTGVVKELPVSKLTAQMVLEEAATTKTGVVLIPAHKQLNHLLVERLIRFSRAGLLVEPVRVRVAS